MRSTILGFFSRFRRRPLESKTNPTKLRTMAESQNEDLQGQDAQSEERRVFDEKTFERGQEALHNGFGTSTHSGDNPFREEDLKNH